MATSGLTIMSAKMCLTDASLKPSDIQYVNAHGTSTPVGDGLESVAVKNIMGDHAKKVWVSSTKSMMGHALGAAGEAARPYVPLLKETLSRQVKSLAPPFGVIERQPNEVCRALKNIGGDEAEAILATKQCKPPWPMLPG